MILSIRILAHRPGAVDDFGHNAGRWVSVGRLRAEVKTLGGRQLEHARQVVHDCTHRVKLIGRRVPPVLQNDQRLETHIEGRRVSMLIRHINLTEKFLLCTEQQ